MSDDELMSEIMLGQTGSKRPRIMSGQAPENAILPTISLLTVPMEVHT